MVISFGGWTPTEKRMNEVSFTDIFDTVYEDDGNNVYVTKKEYEYPDGDEIPPFKYKYLLDVRDIMAYDRETNEIYINLYMVPYHDEDLQKYAETESEEYFFQDAVSNGEAVHFITETIKYNPEDLPSEWYDYHYNPMENEDVANMCHTVAAVIDCIDAVDFGKCMDTPLNLLGTTGWDILKEKEFGIDWIHASIARRKEFTERKDE